MEIKRTINNKVFLFCISTVMLAFILGYILLVSIDKIEDVTLNQFFFSVYTVFTQFGMLFFSIIIIYSISLDYREKNTLFYKLFDIDAKEYFLRKLGVLILWFSISIFLAVAISCAMFRDFSKFFIMFSYLENAIIYVILIALLLGFLFKNMIVAFCANLFIWIFSIILLTILPAQHLIAYFDASNILYKNLEQYLQTGGTEYLAIWKSCLYNLGLFVIVFATVCILKKRWIRNGI
ncbi:putative peptide transport system permease protein [Clostridium sp. DSM 8431]|uniref:hypothetical protein n=1 Tax=Clostridium sp. DSM 8431 TaxID=1761781 RepID=UPI0008E9B4EB|nr:hypothetical protein [Clostridium sp. DSM 8431]SFU85030.1 putative peptide transport system permease protein [Clostridium sp. DSM 8431]